MSESGVDAELPPHDKWPALYEDCREMLESSTLVYGLSTIRELQRNGKLQGSLPDLESSAAPPSIELIKTMFQENNAILKKELGESGYQLYQSMFESMESRGRKPPNIKVFNDINEKTELVYQLDVDSDRKRINVVFRGSVTPKDFMQDAKAHFTNISNPLDLFHGPDELLIHSGFYDYLFCKKKSTESTVVHCKYDIVLEDVLLLLNENPGYKVFVTGHSLGGAIASLVAFQLAKSKDPQIPKPVWCITFASPRVGNAYLARSFDHLEKEGQLCHLRVYNEDDIVAALPPRGIITLPAMVCAPNKLFRHVGIAMKLVDTKRVPFTLRYMNPNHWRLTQFVIDIVKFVTSVLIVAIYLPLTLCGRKNYSTFHSCDEYLRRLENASSKLEKVTFPDVHSQFFKKTNENENADGATE